ncbi:MAG: hypothetical protein ABIF89_00235 [bacterium]
MKKKLPSGVNSDRMKVPEIRALSKEIITKNKNNKKLIKKIGLDLIEKGGWEGCALGSSLLVSVKELVSSQEFEKAIYKMADDPSWEARESAAMLLKKVLPSDFLFFLRTMKKMVKNTNPNIRRGAVVGSMQSALTKEQMLQISRYVYLPLLIDDDPYVRKNLGPFALSQFLRLYPKEALSFFDEVMKKNQPRVIWNVFNAFQLSRIKRSPDLLRASKTYLKNIKGKDDRIIRSAADALERRIKKVVAGRGKRY